jgi:hypothetical protein
VKIPISKILPAKTKGVIRLAIAPKVLFLVLQIRICFIIESITKMINDNNDKINFVCNRTRNEQFACVQQVAKLNFAAVALTITTYLSAYFQCNLTNSGLVTVKV